MLVIKSNRRQCKVMSTRTSVIISLNVAPSRIIVYTKYDIDSARYFGSIGREGARFAGGGAVPAVRRICPERRRRRQPPTVARQPARSDSCPGYASRKYGVASSTHHFGPFCLVIFKF